MTKANKLEYTAFFTAKKKALSNALVSEICLGEQNENLGKN